MSHLEWHYSIQRLKMWGILFVLPIAGYFIASLAVLHFRNETLWQVAPIWARVLGLAVVILDLLYLAISLNNIKTEEQMERSDYFAAAEKLGKIIKESQPDILEMRVQSHINDYEGRKFFFDLLGLKDLM